MLKRHIQTADTSSCGRLFDAVSALLGVCLESRYEAQAAIELESIASERAEAFAFDLGEGEIDLRQSIREMMRALKAGDPIPHLAARFHETIARAVLAACIEIRQSDGLNRVCLSGGCFQNMKLLGATIDKLEQGGFQVYWHSEVPPNDGGLSLGQAAVANALIRP
jgi:hydrogenase maturation protein HypF